MQCPICKTPTPRVHITANDGGSICCPTCASLYHKCHDGTVRTGFSPLTCPHCGYKKEDHVDYLGSFEVNKSDDIKGICHCRD